ncbi:MAG: agmatine deiminase family protein [Candidatus Eisenbacteria bacterium]|nr:agmatine deiminase family protein [Candidatus Eisenbacteria bacterium]
MNQLLLLIIALSVALASAETDLERRTREWMEANPHSLPHWMTPEERTRKDEIGRDFVPTSPPSGPVRNIAEFEHMEGVLIRYPFGISTSIIREMAEDVMVTTIVTGSSQENTVRNTYAAAGVNLNHCNFLYHATDSYWSRDYGPWFITNGSTQVCIVDFPYNRPRPNDDDIPVAMANFMDIPWYGMQLTHTGGNYMTDGMGISASTTLVWSENSGLTHQQIADRVEDYLGVSTYHVVEDPNNTYIDHIDCWGKFLDVDKILIRSVTSTPPQYDEIEATVDYFEAQTSAYGTPFEIYRVYTTTSNQPYTNSLILNNKVLVPITGSSWDDDAIASYQAAMPGYEVLGFTGSWESTDALHCRAMGIADRGMLHIHHLPLVGTVRVNDRYEIQATIQACSGQSVIADSVALLYRVDGGPYSRLAMTNTSGTTWVADIPAQMPGTQIGYYIHAADQSGRRASHPYIGAPDPHVFLVGGLSAPIVSIVRNGGQILLTWDPVPGATTYRVYSAPGPYGAFAEDLSGVFLGATWTVTITGEQHFYRVTATDD